jgi:hypothetical protein
MQGKSMGCRGEQNGQKKRFSDVLNLFGGIGVFSYVVVRSNNIFHVNQCIEAKRKTMKLNEE